MLILGSAVIHVVAHVALKRTHNRAAFVWWMLLWGGLLFSPVLIFGWHPIPPTAWGVMLASAVFEGLYFAAIAQAYRTGDLSIVYPLARGTGCHPKIKTGVNNSPPHSSIHHTNAARSCVRLSATCATT